MKQSEIAPKNAITMLPKDLHLFVVLTCLCGYTLTDSYLLAVNPNIKRSSAQVLASHLRKQRNVQEGAMKLQSYYRNGMQYFDDSFIMIFDNNVK